MCGGRGCILIRCIMSVVLYLPCCELSRHSGCWLISCFVCVLSDQLSHLPYDFRLDIHIFFKTSSVPKPSELPFVLQQQIKLRWALFVTYTIIQSIMRSEMCSLHLTHPSAHTPGAVGSRHCGAGEQLGYRCLAQGSHLSRGHFLPEPGFEPTILGYKSNAISIRPQLP